ncbi:MAG: tetratricopeptide repeat protein [Spirochaetales bacterium]|nr:tetratricopeptide repeat protein [Spirochaetales bacterium]
MMRKSSLYVLIISLIFLTSCSEFNASYKVFRGNYQFLQGEYQTANIQYLRAAEKGIEEDIINYNLGTVYNALGEMDSAVTQWESIDPGENIQLAFRLAYNQGVLHYQLGDYQSAFDSFKEALLFDSSSREARINLEHSFRKLNFQEEPVTSGTGESRESEPGDEDIQRVLEYIRRNEPYYPPGVQKGDDVGRGMDW